MQRFNFGSEENFRCNLIKGQIAKELVRGLLETSGYLVYPFGYESSLSPLRYHVMKSRGRVPDHPSNNRIRSMPDLLVYDEDAQTSSFVEVKFRNQSPPGLVSLKTRELARTQEHWRDSILVVVTPAGHNFYAQKISDLKIFTKSHKYEIENDFRHIEDEFPRVKLDNVASFSAIREQFAAVDSIEQEETDE